MYIVDVGTVITVLLSIMIGSFSLAMLAPSISAVTSAMGAAAAGYVFIEYVQKGFVQASTVAASDGQNVKLDTTVSP